MKNIAVLFLFSTLFIACDKSDDDNHACYDATLVHNNPCTTDCPGITGCDGEFYCNECVAARVGIRPM